MGARFRVVQGGVVPAGPLATDPLEYQADCVEAFVASWRARGFSPVTIENDIGLLDRALRALGRPAWEVTPEEPGGRRPRRAGQVDLHQAGVRADLQGIPPVPAGP